MSAHPSVFELHAFVSRAQSSAGFERHVSTCAGCAARLSEFAARECRPAVVLVEDPQQRRMHAALVALVACVAVLLVRAVTPVFPGALSAPEGDHGVSSPTAVVLFADAGPVDSGVR